MVFEVTFANKPEKEVIIVWCQNERLVFKLLSHFFYLLSCNASENHLNVKKFETKLNKIFT